MVAPHDIHDLYPVTGTKLFPPTGPSESVPSDKQQHKTRLRISGCPNTHIATSIYAKSFSCGVNETTQIQTPTPQASSAGLGSVPRYGEASGHKSVLSHPCSGFETGFLPQSCQSFAKCCFPRAEHRYFLTGQWLKEIRAGRLELFSFTYLTASNTEIHQLIARVQPRSRQELFCSSCR